WRDLEREREMPATAPLVLDKSHHVDEPVRMQVEREPALHLANGALVGKQQTPREREVHVALICRDGREVTDDRVRHTHSSIGSLGSIGSMQGSALVSFLRKRNSSSGL